MQSKEKKKKSREKKSQSAMRIKTPAAEEQIWEAQWERFLLPAALTACPDVLSCSLQRIKMHFMRKVRGSGGAAGIETEQKLIRGFH